MFDKLSNEQKKKYEEKSEKEKEIYKNKIEKFNDKVFDIPHRPLTGFALFVSDRMPDISKEKPNKTNNEVIKMIDKEWQDEIIVDKYIYNKNAKKDLKRFNKQLLEFEKNGFYTKSKKEEEEEDNEDEKKSCKKKKTESKGDLEAIFGFKGLCNKCKHNKDLLYKLEEQQLKINDLSMKVVRLKKENSKIKFQSKRMYNGILFLSKKFKNLNL